MTATSFFRVFLPAAVAVFALAGCGAVIDLHRDSFRPYSPEVVQGNFVSREQRQALSPGMTRAQVRDILGTPLVTSLFHADRWDYVFTIRRQGVESQQFRLTLGFRDDRLSTVEGDELPSEAEFVQRLTRSKPVGKLPALQASEEQLRRYPARSPEPAAAAPSSLPLPATYPPLDSAPR